ncbi:MAG: ABC transporter permease [Peptococcaceae bacterium]|nr:ABC transporter permease [Peptococcaceae bacterium]
MDAKILLMRMKRNTFFKIGVVGIIFIFIACYILPMFIEWDPISTAVTQRFKPPEGFANGFKGHVFGTDHLGRDVLIRLLIGGQYSFRLAFIVVVLQMSIGAVLGIVSGYMGGTIDTLIMRACDAMLSIPGMVLAIAVMAILGTSTRNLILVMTISGWVQLCKVTRNEVRVVKQQEFVMASKILGAKLPHIMFTQIFPNVTTNIIILSSQRMGMTIIMESSLSYLNLGIQAPAPSWGNMISTGRQFLTTQPWLILVPGFALMLTVLSFNFLGDGIRDILDRKRKI